MYGKALSRNPSPFSNNQYLTWGLNIALTLRKLNQLSKPVVRVVVCGCADGVQFD